MSWTFTGPGNSSMPVPPEEIAEHRKQVIALHRYVSRLLMGDSAHAEDIVQETLLRCWRTYGSIANQTLRPWMFRVAKNLVIDGYRSSKHRPQEVDGQLALEYEPAELDAHETVLTEMVVRAGLARLTVAHREALIEVYYRDRTLDEAAQALNIPKGTLKSRLHYGLQALQKALAQTPTA